MSSKNANNFIIFYLFCSSGYAQISTADDSCDSLLNLANRPSTIDSVCSIPFKKAMAELNYEVQQLPARQGIQQNLPNALLRFGLPHQHELFISLPNRLIQTHAPGSGSTSVSIGLKQSIRYNTQWSFALEEVLLPPGGSYAYGAQDWGGSFAGIASFSINDRVNLQGMLSVARYSEPRLIGGKTFYSVNPDVVLSYTINPAWSLYGEIYGQSKLAKDDSAGFNADAGALILLNAHVVLNLSAGQQLYNYLNGIKHYLNVGFSILL